MHYHPSAQTPRTTWCPILCAPSTTSVFSLKPSQQYKEARNINPTLKVWKTYKSEHFILSHFTPHTHSLAPSLRLTHSLVSWQAAMKQRLFFHSFIKWFWDLTGKICSRTVATAVDFSGVFVTVDHIAHCIASIAAPWMPTLSDENAPFCGIQQRLVATTELSHSRLSSNKGSHNSRSFHRSSLTSTQSPTRIHLNCVHPMLMNSPQRRLTQRSSTLLLS